MGMFWGMSTFHEAFRASGTAERAQSDAARARSMADDVEIRLDRALLACEAMWTLLRDKLGVTDVELVERMNAIDLSDGKLDGKVRKTAVACPKCSRTISTRFPKCMYCGQAIVHDPFA